MNTSESIATIATEFIEAQSKIEAAQKSAENKHLKARYADINDVLHAVRPALNEHSLGVMQYFKQDEDQSKITVITRLIHKSGEWMEGEVVIPVLKQDAQGVGSAITYGRRYGLTSLVGLPQEDDDGAAASSPNQGESINSGEIIERLDAAESIKELSSIMNSLPANQRKNFSEHFNDRLNELKAK